MMTFFPVPYDDEVLYSILARYHVRSGNTSYKATMQDIFGSTSVTAVMELPSNIRNLVLNLPHFSPFTEEYLIKYHTLFPFYSAFLPSRRAEQVYESMKGEAGGSIYSRTGIMASSITLNQYFKFCPTCVNEDKQQYGELYWHRVHQISGVMVCPKHHVPTLDSLVPIRGYNKHEYRAACKENCVNPDIAVCFSDKVLEKLINLAIDAQALLNNDFEKRCAEWYKNQYLIRMMDAGFATASGKVNQKVFLKAFVDYYGEDLLEYLQSKVDINHDSNWLMDMVRKKNKTKHPVRHLLLCHFLGLSLTDLFSKKMQYKPFGDGPWPCLNMAANHYLKPVVNHLKVAYSTDLKCPVGTFSCLCGFVYTRSGPDESDDARYRIGRVKNFGTVWEAKLKELVEQKLSLRETSRLLGADTKTVKKYADIFGHTTFWEKRSEPNCDCATNDNQNATVNFDRDYYRGKWKALRIAYPDVGRTQLRQLNKALFTWLYRNDREWLCQNSPDKRTMNVITKRVNWNQRDSEILLLVKKLVANLLNSDEKPTRITIGLIGNRLHMKGLFEKHLGKLPMTEAYLNFINETNADFRLRRICWAVKALEEKGEELQMWRIMRKAGIRDEYKTEVTDAVHKLLEERLQPKT